jgi:hypothetical protein
VEEEPIEIPRTTLVSRPAEEAEVVSVEQGREEASIPVVTPRLGPNRARLLAEQRFKPMAEKRATSIRLEPWLDDALTRRVMELKLEGYRKITREAVITDAVMHYLGVKPPKE